MKIELLAPAGDKQKLQTAFLYGADACYFAGKKYGLRAFSDNFDEDELKQSVEYAHSLGKKCYITLNILAHNKDFEGMKEYIQYLNEIKVDAVIVSDIGIMSIVKQVAPNLEIHVSTQANITNKYSAMEFVKMGAKRLILARELSVEEIKEIRDYIPQEIEIETFVHGAMCISYSGRCLLSNYLSERDSNRGQCVQACRWDYALCEKSRQNNFYQIMEDDRGTYILNSKDLRLIEHLDKLVKAGVTSFKIEGRMKSPYYVANVVNAYKRAIDILKQDLDNYSCPQNLVDELYKSSNRGYTTGFYFDEKMRQNYESSAAKSNADFIALVLEDSKDGKVLIEQRNRFKVGDVLEVLSPNETFLQNIQVKEVYALNGEKVEDCLRVQQKLYLVTDVNLKKNDILRIVH